MRRFFEIEMKAEPNTKRVEQLRAMACLHIWQGIDENLERGYILPGTAIQKKLVEHQGNLKHRSILDDCLEHMDETPILKDSEMGRKIVAINASKVTIAEAVEQVENLGLVAYKALEYRKQLRDWTEENMDKFVAKYLPGIQKLPHDLESRGYITLKIGKNSPYVLIQDTVGGGHV
jgi:nitrate reductase NapAB chaperone NapD